MADTNTEIAEIEATIATDRQAYWGNPEMQERYGELIEARDSGTPLPANVAAEKAAIERMISEDRQAYFNNEAAQARYDEILAAEAEGKAAPVNLPPTEDARDLQEAAVSYWQGDGAEILESWRASGGVKENIALAESELEALTAKLPPETAGEFLGQIDILPMGTQAALLDMLVSPYVARDVVASPDEVSLFASTPEGKHLVKQWGDHAARKVGIFRHKMNGVDGRLKGEDRAAFRHLMDSVTPQEFVVIANHLVS